MAISASASLPFLYLTDENKPSPLTAPTFCMVLRKHIANGRITHIYQPHMERIINMEIEHLNEMGDLCHKTLIIELMGKHSNIIFCDDKGMIIDSIKHVSSAVSSLREVLPGKDYFIPATQEDKYNPLTTPADQIHEIIASKPLTVAKAIYTTFTGVSPLIASEIAYRAGLRQLAVRFRTYNFRLRHDHSKFRCALHNSRIIHRFVLRMKGYHQDNGRNKNTKTASS